MKTKSFKKLSEKLNRNDGISLIAIMTMLVIMSVMGGVFSSVMGRWKISAPTNINSSKALYLAETAAMFALQDAKYRFFSVNAAGTPLYPSAATGTRSAPYVVSSSSTESAEFWIERPYPSANTVSANEIPPNAINVDEYPAGTHRGNNDDDTTGVDDDNVDDDGDDSSNDPDTKLYTIIATGKVKRGGTTVAKRQIKIKATVESNTNSDVAPGVHTDGGIAGTGPPDDAHFDMDNPTSGANVTYGNGTSLPDPPTSGNEAGIVHRPSPTLDSEMFKVLATEQGHYHGGNYSASDDYPNGSYYYSGNVPNIVYVEGDLTINGNIVIYGVYWIKGSTTVFNGNYQVNGIIICEGDLTMNGGGSMSPNMDGGIIQYGATSTLTGNGSPVDIDINEDYFRDMNNALPIVTVVSSQEAVSAN
jgi:hypothetical protein